MKIWPKTWLARIPWVLVFVLFAYIGAAYFGVPALIRYLIQNQAAAALHRRVTVGDVNFNPYTLRLDMANLNVRGRGSARHFIEIDHVNLRLSWTSLSHLALVVKELTVERPSIRIARLGPQTFDFSDLLSSFGQGRKSNRGSLSFAVSNIEVNDGLILFDDHMLKKQHRLENIRLAIPFIANLPTDADKYVEPMLQMTIDGSPMSLTGKTKLFRGNLESVVELNFQKLDIAPFVGYAADKLPFKLREAELSAALQLHFIQVEGQPQLQAGGTATLENVVMHDLSDSPLAELKQLRAAIAQVEPFTAKLHFSSIDIDSLTSHVIVNHDDTTNPSWLFNGYSVPTPPTIQTQGAKSVVSRPAPNPNVSPAPVPPPALFNPMAAAPSGAASGTYAPSSASGENTYATSNAQTALSVDSLELTNSTLDITDRAGPAPVSMKLQAIHLGLKNFATAGGTPASYNFNANLNTGGRLTANGSFNLASSEATSKLTLANIELPALQGLITPVLAAAIVSGKLSAQTTVRAAFGRHSNVHAEHAGITIDGAELRPPRQAQSIVGWKHLTANIDQFDFASHQAAVGELRVNGLRMIALRDSHGNVNLTSLFSGQPQISQDASGQIATGSGLSAWRYRIASIVLENADATIEDDAQPQPLLLRITPLNIRLNGMTNDLAKPITIQADGNMARRGTFKLAGETAINPFQARFHINTAGIDMAWLDPIIASALGDRQLNAKITNGKLAMNGDAQAQFRDGGFDAAYQGDVTLGNVQMIDKPTGVSFLRWYALSLGGLDVRYGEGKPRAQIGTMALTNFYIRLILNADGRLNLSDIVSRAGQPPVSLTQPSVTPLTETAPSTLPAEITIGSFSFQNGELDYLDRFIRPNYSAVVTQLDGKIGAFGTNSTKAADVLLVGKVNRTSPITISGSINPLTPMASLDLQADASRIELPPLTPYATKYTGYPITGGTLSGNVHYKLAKRQLSATNHLILDQLSFGNRVENSSARNLPMRLAVAVLKDSQGRIDVRIPVSGSLADPDFDLGRIVWQGLVNVIMKAATSPFKVLASAVGEGKQNLSYVEFAPGYSTLTQPGRNKIATLAMLLKQRPWLKLQIIGRVDPRIDRQGLSEATLEDAIKRQKAEDEHQKIAPDAIEQVEVTPDQYNKYLRRVYKAADFAKPRNFMGMVKSIPPDEMKKLLLSNIKVTDEDLRHLADARAAAVYKALSAKVAQSRLLIAAPKLNADGITEGPTTRVDFSLQ